MVAVLTAAYLHHRRGYLASHSMRPIRFLLTLVSCSVVFLLLLAIGPWRGSTEETAQVRGNMGAFFDWRTPSSLFPPSAIISITDDNSTNFLARPAAFGPLLPPSSLTGQVWIGSGFGDDHLGRGGSGAGAEGELGCSDVPGWDDGTWYGSGSGKKTTGENKKTASDSTILGGNGKSKRSSTLEEEDEDVAKAERPAENDGTDDYLHHPLGSKGDASGNTNKPTHADIQSLQESAEISGKIVLLSRGGCGFLEKVKWVQRRGGVALIVGDNVRGGPLVTMYARGETSNVTIPSVFISHMTAQLLSSLMPTGSVAGYDDDDSNRLAVAAGSNGKVNAVKMKADTSSATTTDTHSRHKYKPKVTKPDKGKKKDSEGAERKDTPSQPGSLKSWLGSSADNSEDSRRPPSSGNIGLILHKEVEDELTGEIIIVKAAVTSTSTASTVTPKNTSGDGFVIGVQDWRDPDLVAEQKELHLQVQHEESSSAASDVVGDVKSTDVPVSSLKGGSITPSSGEYAKSHQEAIDVSHATESGLKHSTSPSQQTAADDQPGSSRSWVGRLFHHSKPGKTAKPDSNPHEAALQAAPNHDRVHHANSGSSPRLQTDSSILSPDGPPRHDGLWVTLSPASMSSSPFFDTLLVLVVSPLVTLTVVYALLLLRSRIRRRRWRAPKSVVERLPVRTYQTMPSGTSSSTSSSVTSFPSATTPLLPTASRPIRPRSRTASEAEPQSPSLLSDRMASPSLEQIEEKRAAGLAEWRRRYGGKQRECVVCLDEYVDGVSRVMSLPCGHEFHAECM